VPYLRWDDRSAVLVAVNRSREQDASIKISLTLSGTGLEDREH